MRTSVTACRWPSALLAVIVSQLLAAPSGFSSDWRSSGRLIEEGRLEEALERLVAAREQGLDREGLEEATRLLEQLAHTAELADRSRVTVSSLVALANTESELGRYRDARETLGRAEALWRTDPDPDLGIDLWNAHGFRLSYQGEPAAALDYRRRALDLARQTGDRERARSLLVSLGQNQLGLHDYAGALGTFREALVLDLAGIRHVIAFAGLGIAHFELNQLDEAEEAFERARALAVETGNPRFEAWAVGELGTLMIKRDEPQRALELLDRSIAMLSELGDVRNEVVFRINRGSLLRDLGRCREALESNREAEAQLAAIEGQRPNPILAKNSADCLLELGRLDEANERYREAIEQALVSGERKAHWQAFWGLARLFRRQERATAADQAFRQALEVIEDLRGSLRLESFKTSFFEDKIEVYAAYLEFLVGDGREKGGTARALEVAERARARAFLDTLAESRADLHETLPPEMLAAEADLLESIAEIQSRLERDGPAATTRRELAALEDRLEELYLRVRREVPRFRELRYPEPASIEEVRGLLRPGEVLAEYFLAEPRSHLWIVRGDDVAWHALPPRSEIESAVRTGYGRLVDPGREPRGLSELAAMLVAPLEGIEPGSSLLVVPSGILHYFPLEVLPFGATGEPLGAHFATTYLPSASTLVAIRRHSDPTVEPRLLAVGDPAYLPRAGPGRNADISEPGLLPHTRREVEELARRFGSRRATLLLGPGATETELAKQPLASFSLLHLAAHGRIDTDHPERSALLLADPPESAEDGLLQMREIYRLPLAAELVTLSACRTAMGELVSGEGMVGLSRAFQYAGADSIVASLWSVSDEATARFMEHFYGELERGATKAEALRRARLALRDTAGYAHPYFWAAYVLIGEGADGVRFPSTARRDAMIALGLLTLLAVLVVAWRRRRARH